MNRLIGSIGTSGNRIVIERFLIQNRSFHVTGRRESISPLIIGGSIAVIAYGGKIMVEAIDRKFLDENDNEEGDDKNKKSGENPFFSFFNFGKRFYEGGFEQEMTRREAALILGIRESANRDKIREAHRRLAMINHPDQGGSTYVATKINEAKDKLLGLGGNHN